MSTKSLFVAAALAFAIASPTYAATYDFSFDSSIATSGDTSMMAFGTLDINAAAGSPFVNADISNVSITVSSDLFGSFTADNAVAITGVVSADGMSASFTEFFIRNGASPASGLACGLEGCFDGRVIAFEGLTSHIAWFADQGAALSAFTATAQVSAVPLPAGGLLLLSGLAGVIGLKRRKRRAT